jgi:WS/DGAT/MGAT family acyltransferase
MKSLSAADGLFLHVETPDTPMHVASLHLFDPVSGRRFVTLLKRHLARRMHLVPIFQRRLASMPLDLANPVWVHDENVDLDYHVQHMTLPAPGSHAQFEALAARLHMEPLDRSRPLWRLVVIDGLASGEVGLYAQFHHAVLDGQSGVLLANALYDTTPRPRRVRRPLEEPAEHPGIGELAAEALRHDADQALDILKHSPDVLRSLAGLVTSSVAGAPSPVPGLGFAPRTALNVPITRERGVAVASIPLAALKRIAAAYEAKLNDVVLALCSGVMRRWLGSHGGIPRHSLIAAVPVSIRKPGNEDYTTEATMVEMSLATDIADPVERLLAIRDAAGAVKAMARRTRELQRTDFPTIGVPWMLKAGAWLYGRFQLADTVPPVANLTVSNVAGAQTPLYMCGIRMRTYWPLSIVEHGSALNLTVQSYAGGMHFGFTVAHNAVPDASELTQALGESLDELLHTVRPQRAAPARAAARRATQAPVRRAPHPARRRAAHVASSGGSREDR